MCNITESSKHLPLFRSRLFSRMAGRLLATSKDGRYHFLQMTSKYLPGALDVIRQSYFRDENSCKAVGLPTHDAAQDELNQANISMATDGISVVAVDQETDRPVGACFNKLHVRRSPGGNTMYYQDFIRTAKFGPSRAVAQFMHDAHHLVNLFDISKSDCYFEMVFTAVLREHRGKGIENEAINSSIQIGRELNNGQNVKQSLEGHSMSLDPIPGAFGAVCTTFITQHIARERGFTEGAEMRYDGMRNEKGELFADIIGKETRGAMFVYKVLDK